MIYFGLNEGRKLSYIMRFVVKKKKKFYNYDKSGSTDLDVS